MEVSQIPQNIIDEKENNEISSHKYNLYQQFFVISIDPKIMYNINELDLKNVPEPLSIPKVISKYPNIDLPYLIIPDIIIASHCFPQGIISSIVDYEPKNLKEKRKVTENFIFSLENMYPETKISSLKINKVYFTCLLFYEDIEDYRDCINQRKNYKNSDINKNAQRNKGLLIPKVICLSSFSPFYEQTKYVLNQIKNYVDNYNVNRRSIDNINIYPIEKIIEGLIFSIPALPRGNNIIKLDKNSFSFNSLEKNLQNNKNEVDDNNGEIIFKETCPNKNHRIPVNYSILMNYFKIEEIFEVIKFIILEEPIIFFCEDKEILSKVIESFVSLIYPLEYPHPIMTILPEENFSLIPIFKNFIFGINVKYSEDYFFKKIILDGIKFIRIIKLEKRFNSILNNIINSEENDILKFSIFTSVKADENKPLIRINESSGNSFKEDEKDFQKINEKKNINLPRHYYEKCLRRLEKEVLEKVKDISKNKNKLNDLEKEKEDIFNNEISETFLYFFSCILLKYQEYCVKYEKKEYADKDKEGNIVVKEFGERNCKLDQKYYMGKIELNDIFDSKEFIDSIPSLDRAFYNVFFETKIFYNFIFKKIFPDSNQDKLDILYFDEIINKKLGRETRIQKIETKFLEYNYDNKNKEIIIKSLKRPVNSDLTKYLQKNKNREKALNYFQFIHSNFDEDDDSIDEEAISENKDHIYFYYYVFPILLNDGIFYTENKNKWKNSEFFKESLNSDILYKKFEEESALIIDNDEIYKNYRIYNYSLNPTSQFHLKNEYMIKMLWLRYFSKIFNSIPISQKKYYFEIINSFLKKNNNLIDERTILILFNSINKYGDRNMNQDFFINIKNKTYTSYLYLREKVKPENNFIKYIKSQDITNQKIANSTNNENLTNSNNQKNTEVKNPFQKKIQKEIEIKEKKLIIFKVNSFCRGKKEELNLYQKSKPNLKTDDKDINICNEPLVEKVSELYSDSDEYIQCKCNKCFKNQRLKISCEYNDEDNNEYIIDFELLSPMALLKQNWFQNNSELDLSFICEEYLESYLSAIFYFYEQNLPCEFLLPDITKQKTNNELKEIRNLSYSNINSKDIYDQKDIDKIIQYENKKNDNNIYVEAEREEENIKNSTKEKKYSDNTEKNIKSCFKGKKRSLKNVEFKV